MRELAAFQRESERIEATLRTVKAEDWTRSALGEWSMLELAAHMIRGAGRVAAYLAEPVEGPAGKDRVSYWRYDTAATSGGVASRARDEARTLVPDQVADSFAHAWRAGVEAARGLPGDHLTITIFGPMHLQEFVATRVLEAVVHHMDARRALDLPVDPDPEAADIVVETLEGLLGGPRPRNLGRDRFVLAATGRIPHDDPRFPVLG